MYVYRTQFTASMVLVTCLFTLSIFLLGIAYLLFGNNHTHYSLCFYISEDPAVAQSCSVKSVRILHCLMSVPSYLSSEQTVGFLHEGTDRRV